MYVPITKYPWGGSFCPEAFAEAKLTGSGLNFRLWCCEKHPRVTMTKPNSLVCLDSCLEVFLNPYPDFTRDYLNFEMNAAGTLLLQKGPDRAHRSFVNLAVPHYPQVHAWQLPDVWGVELEVPFAFLQQIYGRNVTPVGLLPIPLTLISTARTRSGRYRSAGKEIMGNSC